jgi:hypothetical protein
MKSHFLEIGFDYDPRVGQELIERAYKYGQIVKSPHGQYVAWRQGDGAELWVNFVTGRQGWEATGVNPHYAGSAQMHVLVDRFVRDPKYRLDGEVRCWAAPTGTAMSPKADGLFPFAASLPDFDAEADKKKPPFRCILQVAAFPSELEYYRDEAAYREKHHEMGDMAPQSFVPVGQFEPGPNGSQAYGLFSGSIRSVEKKRNGATGLEYYALLVETYGGQIDVVLAPSDIREAPTAGGQITVKAWLSARILTRQRP